MNYSIIFEKDLRDEATLLSSYLLQLDKNTGTELVSISDLVNKTFTLKYASNGKGHEFIILIPSLDYFKKSELFELSQLLPKNSKIHIFFDTLDIQNCLADTLHFELLENWLALNQMLLKINTIPIQFANFLVLSEERALALNKACNNVFCSPLSSLSHIAENNTPTKTNSSKKILSITLFLNTSSQSDITSIQALFNKLDRDLIKSEFSFKLVYYGENAESVKNKIRFSKASLLSLSEWLSLKTHDNETILYSYLTTARSNLDVMLARELEIPIISLNSIIQNIQVSDLEWDESEELSEKRTATNLEEVLGSSELQEQHKWKPDPEVFETLDLVLKAYALIKSGSLLEAKQLLVRVLDTHPYEKSVYIALAQINIITKQYDDAFIWSECAQFLETKSPGTLIALGMILAKRKNIPHSRECFERAIKVAPLFDKPKKLLAALEYEVSNFPRAITLFEEVLTVQPTDKEALFGILQSYKKVDNQDKISEMTKRLNEVNAKSSK